MTLSQDKYVVILPAAGVGKRMKAHCPKQYLSIQGQTILEHTVNKLLSHPQILHIVLPLSEGDEYFEETSLPNVDRVIRVNGGAERVGSVLNGLRSVNPELSPWVLVHDAARPCLTHHDITQLITSCIHHQYGGLLAYPVRDTMKNTTSESLLVDKTVDRSSLWHALTPQMYKTTELIQAITHAQASGINITDESSAIEAFGLPSALVEGRSDNIKITRPDDLAFAEFILMNQKQNITPSKETN